MTQPKIRKVPVIAVPHGSTTKIAKHMGCTIQAVRNALKYISNSEQAQRIRREALENYGGWQTTAQIQV